MEYTFKNVNFDGGFSIGDYTGNVNNVGISPQQKLKKLQNLIIFLDDNEQKAFNEAIANLESSPAYDDEKALGLLQLIKIAEFKLNPNKDEQTLVKAKRALETLKILVPKTEISLN